MDVDKKKLDELRRRVQKQLRGHSKQAQPNVAAGATGH